MYIISFIIKYVNTLDSFIKYSFFGGKRGGVYKRKQPAFASCFHKVEALCL